MRITNKTKYAKLWEELQQRGTAFVDELFKNTARPTVVYGFFDRTGDIGEAVVTQIRYSWTFYKPEKPTNEQIKRLTDYLLKNEPLDLKRVFVHFEYAMSGFKRCEAACPYIEISGRRMLALTREELEAESAMRKEAVRLLESGTHNKCYQCGKVYPKEQAVTREIRVNREDRKMTFCSYVCGEHYQWGCEG